MNTRLLQRLRALALHHGTPTQVYDEPAVLERYPMLRRTLGVERLLYAVKCNPHRSLLATLVRLGSHFEIVAPSELETLIELGCTPDRIVYAHPIRRPVDLVAAARHGLRNFVIDDVEAHEMLASNVADHRCLLRVRGANGSSRYGFTADEARRALERSPALRARTVGLCMHHGPYDKVADVDSFVGGLSAMREVCAVPGVEWRILDLGGGYPEHPSERNPIFRACTEAVAQARRGWAQAFEVWAEPGRSIAAPAFHLVTTVLARRIRGEVTHYYVDDSVYGSYLDAATTNRRYDFAALGDGNPRPSVIYGATCDGIDVIAREASLPLLEVRDYIFCTRAGAYTTSLTSGFNGIRRPVGAALMKEAVLDGPQYAQGSK